MKKYISEVTYVVRWLYKWRYFKDDNEIKEVIRRLEFADDKVIECDLKNFEYMQFLEHCRNSQSKDKNLNRVGQEIKERGVKG